MGFCVIAIFEIVTWGLFCFGKISLDTVVIAGMIFGLGLIIYEKR